MGAGHVWCSEVFTILSALNYLRIIRNPLINIHTLNPANTNGELEATFLQLSTAET